MSGNNNKQTKGRQKIPMQLIQNQDDLYSSFSKRRMGLFKKSSELCTLCGVHIGVIIFSPKNHPHSFFSPSANSVIDRYQNPNQQLSDFSRFLKAHTRAKTDNLNRMLDRAREGEEGAKQWKKHLAEDAKHKPPIDPSWEDHESMTPEQRAQWYAYFKYINEETTRILEEAEAGGLGPSGVNHQQNNDADEVVPPPHDDNQNPYFRGHGGGDGAGPSNAQP